MNDDEKMQVAKVIDDLESILAGLNIPLPAPFHIEQIKSLLPEKIDTLKKAINYDELIYG